MRPSLGYLCRREARLRRYFAISISTGHARLISRAAQAAADRLETLFGVLKTFEIGLDPSRTPTRSEPNRPAGYPQQTHQRLGDITLCAATICDDWTGVVLATETPPDCV